MSLGLNDREIDYRSEIGRLHTVHRGVFSVGHRVLSVQGRWMAAVLAGGPGAVLSHRSAAALHGLLPSWAGSIHVTVPRKLRSRRGLAFHRARFPADEIVRVDGIPTTGVSRTLLDVAARGSEHEVDRALHQAEVIHATDTLSVTDLIDRYPRRQGVAKIRAVLADRRLGVTATRSELEELFLAFIRERRLPQPEVNAWLMVGANWYEVDCLWRDHWLIGELDSRAFHHAIRAFERDRAKDRALQVEGWRVLRVTWRQLHDAPDALAADLGALLFQRRIRR